MLKNTSWFGIVAIEIRGWRWSKRTIRTDPTRFRVRNDFLIDLSTYHQPIINLSLPEETNISDQNKRHALFPSKRQKRHDIFYFFDSEHLFTTIKTPKESLLLLQSASPKEFQKHVTQNSYNRKKEKKKEPSSYVIKLWQVFLFFHDFVFVVSSLFCITFLTSSRQFSSSFNSSVSAKLSLAYIHIHKHICQPFIHCDQKS